MNWGEIKSEVRTHLRRGTDLTDATLDVYAKRALRQIVQMRDWNWLTARRLADAVDAEIVPLPTDCKAVEGLYIIDGAERYVIRPKSLTETRKLYDTNTTAEPEFYSVVGTDIYLTPPPQKQYTLEIVYKRKFDILGDTSTNYVTEELALPLIYLTASLVAAGYYQDAGLAQRYGGLFMDTITSDEEADDRIERDDNGGLVEPFTYIEYWRG